MRLSRLVVVCFFDLVEIVCAGFTLLKRSRQHRGDVAAALTYPGLQVPVWVGQPAAGPTRLGG